jgi:IclR family transcriptional regulator, KDG regulon repressor
LEITFLSKEFSGEGAGVERKTKNKSITDDYLKTVMTSLDVIECIAEAGEPVRLTDISNELCLSKSQVHRILTTLAGRKYIYQEEDSQRYSLGINSWLLGYRVGIRYPLLKVARPILDEITHEETVYLALLDGNESHYLYIRDGTHPVRAVVKVGEYGPLYATATGKAMLAFQTQEYIHQYLVQDRKKFTLNTITDSHILIGEIIKTKNQGYSVVIDELEVGLSGVGAPVLNKNGLCFAAIGVSIPTYRFSDDNLDNMASMATEAALEISNRL